MIFRWFSSRTVRQASEMVRQMGRLLNEQRDLLSPEAITALSNAQAEARQVIRSGAGKDQIKAEMKRLEDVAARWLKHYPYPGVRENVKEFLVAVVVILSFTTFFLQLTKIPTGSMQPTLYGITYENLQDNENFEMPPFYKRFLLYWAYGISYKHLVAPFDGYVLRVEAPKTVLPFVKKQPVLFGDPNNPAQREWLNIWFPPDDRLLQAADLDPSRRYRKGESIIKLKAVAGDHLLVDRFTYNFRKPQRGEIIVFKTRGIQGLDNNLLYIKRLVGLPGEKVQISNDQRLIIDGDELTASDRHFEYLYTFDSNPGENRYMGHVNEAVARQRFNRNIPAPLFPNENAVHVVGPHHYLAMGDNTLNSLDSRAWGDLPQANVIGRCWFVYWPFTERFGWGYR